MSVGKLSVPSLASVGLLDGPLVTSERRNWGPLLPLEFQVLTARAPAEDPLPAEVRAATYYGLERGRLEESFVRRAATRRT